MSLTGTGSDSGEHQSADTSHGFVTVIPVEYSRHRGFLQPPDQYSDFKPRENETEHNDCVSFGKYSQIEEIGIHTKPYKSNTGYDTSNKEWDKANNIKEQTFISSSQSMKVCIYMMTDVALRMDVEDGVNATVHELVQSIVSEEQLRLTRVAATIFTLWMTSGLLELQLKPHHKPLSIRTKWPSLLNKYAHASESRQRRDEPILSFQRNVFFPLNQEERIKDEKILELLYAEAKYNILEGRYPCEMAQYIMLGSIQARIELGPYNPQFHTLQFFREQHGRFLPAHMRNGSWNSWLRLSSKDTPEVRLLEHYRRLPDRKLHKKYLEFCWTLPYYGSAFFQGQIEQPVRGLTSLVTHQDIPVLVGINAQGVYVINNVQCTLLVGLKYEEFSWDFAKPSQEENPDCLPCLFLQFRVVENGTRVSKILQIFSKQAVMMDVLITGFVEDTKQKLSSSGSERNTQIYESSTDTNDSNLPLGVAATCKDTTHSFLTNKLRKLTLATFDEEGRCIGQMGSWSFSY
ncbi:FERM domain-containing protein 8 isoform X2 [Cimex lectularius]|uniref:FERM domain-containing protein 8 n=1 Tax=Cimex lectularius TaxID=79782 RepID=A0A8I6SG93_CIMLE|nr:FERM domain-containing protein 8 isoform X2 [Cimex lectularius]